MILAGKARTGLIDAFHNMSYANHDSRRALFRQIDANRRRLRSGVLGAFVAGDFLLAVLIVLSLAGALHSVDIPDAYRATYRF